MNDKVDNTGTDTEVAESTEGKTTVSADRSKYKTTRSASGAKSLSNGDAVATAVEGATIDDMYTLAKKMCGEDFREKYSHLNIGMQRMNLGNRIRGAIAKLNKAGATVKEGEKANPTAGDDKFTEVSAPLTERIAKRVEKEATVKAKIVADKVKEAERKAKVDAAAKEKADAAKAKAAK